ncbi:hypothetical protein SAMD00079811_46760 [Scytonema sp. HK-05]|nr:hypothetical protein NIES2130_11725 [Scytonema sp. HK-05]BAY47060.1 hypothetical protein SAMD00079811_46760 [Scytonema sp. HK-05]
MSFLANSFNLLLEKIDNRNLPCHSQVGRCWIGLSFAANCGLMQLQSGRQASQIHKSQLFDLSGYFFTNNIKQS